jgi:hypothetical protein
MIEEFSHSGENKAYIKHMKIPLREKISHPT